MKIAAVIHQFPPDFETGTEVLCLATMQALAARGHDVLVFAADPHRAAGEAPRNERVGGIAVIRIPTRLPRRLTLARRLVDEFSNPAAQALLLREVTAFGPDVIHGYQALQFGLAALPRLAGIAPLVLTATDFHLACPSVTGAFEDGSACPGSQADGQSCLMHVEAREAARIAAAAGWRGLALKLRAGLARAIPGLDGPGRRRTAMQARQAASRAALQAASAILAGSARIREMLVGAGAPPDTTELFAHAAPPVAVPERPIGETLRVAFFGTLSPHKGPHVLLDAIPLLAAETRLSFTICGPPGPDAAYAQEIIARCTALARTTYRPAVANAAFGALMGEADIVALPSLWEENRPLTLLTALEAGRYAVTSDSAGLAGELQGGGETFPAGDAGALAAILRRLAADPRPVHAVRRNPVRQPAFAPYIEALERRLATAAEARR
ncbi:hypothetical protein sos41_36670 [Alphaproteobacteria bacterium SO-S41]|nr:hypothetical protein sos41_36670 [Alphaproteobacteria bacterium SO-S41]